MFVSNSNYSAEVTRFVYGMEHDQISTMRDGVHIILNATEALLWRDSLTLALARREILLEGLEQKKVEPEPVASAEPPNPEEF